jgi:hypothetical protein
MEVLMQTELPILQKGPLPEGTILQEVPILPEGLLPEVPMLTEVPIPPEGAILQEALMQMGATLKRLEKKFEIRAMSNSLLRLTIS